MGMTYMIIAENGKLTEEVVNYISKVRDDYPYIAINDDKLELTDDMIFDRECLGIWMGLTEADYIDFNYKFRITKEHLDRAISTLQTLVDKVSSMPFVGGHGSYTDCLKKYNPNGEDELIFTGPPENIAIMKEVQKVFIREYHYTYPWEDDGSTTRQGEMIRALKVTKEFMEKFPDWNIMGLYF